MTFRELFQVLEPDSATQLSSRFKDAYIINDLTIITNSDTYWDWCDSWLVRKSRISSTNEKNQVYNQNGS